MTPFDTALAVIDGQFAEPVLYTGAGLPEPTTVTVIWSDTTGVRFQGPGETTREVSVEIAKAKLPGRPTRADRLVRAGVTYAPNDIVDRDDVGAWVLILEKAA